MSLPSRRGLLLPLSLAFGFALLAILALSGAPLPALRAFLLGPFSSPWALASLANEIAPLLIAGLGASFAFRAGIFNLGGEGQAALGLLVGALLLEAGQAWLPPFLLLPLALGASFLAGLAPAWLSGLAEGRWGASVLLTSFLLSQILLVLVSWALGGPLRDPASNLLGMAPLPGSLLFPRLLPGLPLGAGLPLALLLCLASVLFLGATRRGFELRLFGLSRPFAEAQGLPKTLKIWPLLVSGGLSGLAGLSLLLGGSGQAIQGQSSGLGWNGLAIALIARTDPLLVLPAAFLFSYMDAGARSAAVGSDLPGELSLAMKALILLVVTLRAEGARGGRR